MAKVYKKITVTKTLEMIVGVEEDRLTPKFLEHFSKHFYGVDEPEDIFEAVGYQYVQGATNFAEGVGKVGDRWDKNKKDFAALVRVLVEDVELEVGETCSNLDS